MSQPPLAGPFAFGDSPAKLLAARGAIIANRRLFRALEQYAASAPDQLAPSRAHIAIASATPRQTGLLVSGVLERRLNQIGRELPALHQPPPRPTNGAAVKRVLHVMTEAAPWGGHTRVVERWMLADLDRRPTVAMTGQGRPYPIPPSLQTAASAAGGAVLSITGDDAQTRAWNLRALAAQHDLVVLHAHGFDVVPMLAFADPEQRPPTILFNHASHEIWLGVGVADVVANLQPVDDLHTRTRRGADADASMMLPIPVQPRQLPSREQARAQLGIASDTPLVVSVAQAYKIGSVIDPAFVDLVAAAAEHASAARFIVVGPACEGRWAQLQQATGGRVQAIGLQPSQLLDTLLPAADLMLDTWPLSGGTTRLDAAYASLPIVSLSDGSVELAMVRPPSDALGGAVVNVPDPSEIAAAVADLLTDADALAERGARARRFIEEQHADTWRDHLEPVVAGAVRRTALARPPAVDPPAQVTDWEAVIQLANVSAKLDSPPEQVLVEHAHALAPEDREPNLDAARSTVEMIVERFTPPTRRAVASTEVDAESVRRLITHLVGLVESEAIDICTVAVPTDLLEAAVPLFEAAMMDASQLDIELVAADAPEAIARRYGCALIDQAQIEST